MGVLAGSLLARAVAHGAPNGQTGAATVPGNQTPSIYATEFPAGVELIRRRTTIEAWVGGRRRDERCRSQKLGGKGRLYRRAKPQPLRFVSFASAPWSSQSS